MVRMELYTDKKDLDVENKVTSILNKHGIFYTQTEMWIESEKLYEVVFTFEVMMGG
ncbi:hypothetical protein P261_02622 [Lachnospiraceae bacterium TWA4]|nr:hypothetical protein P261_02622 [Lachnospiraceae bacterium TWA4]